MTGDELRAARLRLGLSQEGLAEVFGVPASTVWRWETGKHAIERPRVLALALAELARRRASPATLAGGARAARRRS